MIINNTEVHLLFDYVRAIAKYGGGIENSRLRTYHFFQSNSSLKERTQQIYEEYHNGGFGLAFCERSKPFLLQGISCFGKHIDAEYTDGLGVLHEVKVNYRDVAIATDKLIAEGKFLTAKDLASMGGAE